MADRTTITQIINVTAKHIAEGLKGDACWCPIARAIRDQVPSEEEVYVFPAGVSVAGGTTMLPDEALRFVQDFDAGLSVEPFSFALDIPIGEDI